MKKKDKINLSLPATLSDFQRDESNENFSRAKLRVFHDHETADHRHFSTSCIAQLEESLPYTPIVTYYDAEADDFVGHATEQQILGIVDPTKDIAHEVDEDGNNWTTASVVLYTERPDQVGDLAKRVVGHAHSLEMDPNSVEYDIIYDEKKRFKHIEFTAAKFVGLSVLGSNQQPAFTGSAFFTKYDNHFENKMRMLKEYCESNNQTQGGSKQMNIRDFMKLSWGEKADKIFDALVAEYKDCLFNVIAFYDDNFIVNIFYLATQEQKLLKINYVFDAEGKCTLGDVVEVRVEYVPVEDDEPNANSNYEEAEAEASEVFVENEGVEVVSETAETKEPVVEEAGEVTEMSEAVTEVEEPVAEPVSEEDTVGSSAEFTHNEAKVSVGDEQNRTNEEEESPSSATSFDSSEREELEALKREKKINLIQSYKEILTDEEEQEFVSSVDNYTYDEIELKLLKRYKASSEDKAHKGTAFAFAPILDNTKDSNPMDDFIRKHL